MTIDFSETKRPLNVVEVGVGNPLYSKTAPLWQNATWRFTLYEPNPVLYKDLVKLTSQHANVRVVSLAFDTQPGFRDLVLASDRSFLAGTHSPMQHLYHGRFEALLGRYRIPVWCERFVEHDPRDIDLLYLGVEGHEWAVLQYLVSRPIVVALNNYEANDYGYVMPYCDEIVGWFKRNGYTLVKRDADWLLYLRGEMSVGGLTLPS